MNILLDRKLILSKFLIPLSKFTDQAIVSLNKDYIDCISYSTAEKQSVILYTKLVIKSVEKVEDAVKLNIGSIKKLINALSCIDKDIIELTIDKNAISYTSDETSFKFHLKEDGVLEKPPINVDKINAMTFETSTLVPAAKIDEIIKAGGFSTDSSKIYIYIKNNIMFAELTDRNIQNLDTIKVVLTNKITGTPFDKEIPMRIDIFRILSTIHFDQLNMSFNKKGMVVFEIKDDNYLMKYVTSSLVK